MENRNSNLADRARRLVAKSIAASALAMAIVGVAHAEETQFYGNTKVGSIGFPTYYDGGGGEFADDVPFSGTHLVSAFTIGYTTSQPVRAIFRFYGVNQSTGLPGSGPIRQIERELPAGENLQTIALSETERFEWTAEPNLYPGQFLGVVPTGGWYSVQFAPVGGTGDPGDARFRLATGTSASGFLDVSTGRIITNLDPSGTLPTSMYLQLQDEESSGVDQPALARITVYPATVTAGASASTQVVLLSQAPYEGTGVKLTSSNPKVVDVPSEVVVPAGATNLVFSANTRKRNRRTEVVTLTAEANGSRVSTTLTVTPAF